jgi:hypothetical protein
MGSPVPPGTRGRNGELELVPLLGAAGGNQLASMDCVPGVADLEAEVMEAVAVLIEKLPEGGGVLVRFVQLDDEPPLRNFDHRQLEAVSGGLAAVLLVWIWLGLGDADVRARRVEEGAPGLNAVLDVVDDEGDLDETVEGNGMVHNAPWVNGCRRFE